MPIAKYHEYEDQLWELVEVKKLQLHKVAEILGVHRTTVGHWCRRFGIKTQRVGPRTGVACKGGRYIGKGGYVYIFRPDHPWSTKKGYVLRSRLVMEQKLGRYLGNKEVVHHLNKKTDDDRTENLSLFPSNGDHLRHELTGHCPNWSPEGWEKICDAIRIPEQSRYRL
ncbi:MAG: hypothetical protein PF495_05205 [Spirochaetales bacterium]|nr:hypothetical protein [Spirochaetales bacterium]